MARKDSHTRDGVEKLLRAVPRRDPPAIELESIFERGRRASRRRGALGALILAAGLAIPFLLPQDRPEPPVHRELQIVDVAPADTVGPTGWDALPEELRAP